LELAIPSEHKCKVGDIDQMQQDIKAKKEASIDADFQMKIAVEETIYSTIYSDAGNSLTQAALDKTNVLEWIIDAKTKLAKSNIPNEGRWIILPPEITGLLDKSDLKNAALMGDGPSLLRRAPDYFGRIAGFDVYESNCLTTTSSGTIHHVIAGQRNGLTYAGQMNKVESVRLQDYIGDAVRGLMVFGYKVNVPNALVHMPATVA
jgi:hypothetical protein